MKKPAIKKVRQHGTDKTYMPRVRKEFVDMDYLGELSEKDRAYIEKFNREYYGRSLNIEKPHRNLHKSKKLIKDCSDRNNRQNNDLYGVTKINGLLDTEVINNSVSSIEGYEYVHPSQENNLNNTENAMIEYVDNKQLMEYDTKELAIMLENAEFFEGNKSSKNESDNSGGNLKK